MSEGHIFQFWRVVWTALLCLVFGLSSNVIGSTAHAAENAAGIYLLGSKSSMAGFVPPPGTYFSVIDYYYTGSASGAAADGVALNDLGNITVQADVNVDADAFIALPTLLWITPHKVLGGNFGIGVIGVLGWKDVDIGVNARAALTLPNGETFPAGRRFSLGDDTFDLGDPLITALIGWHQGNWHWNVSGLLNIPVADYDTNSSSNIAFNRWAFDVTGAVTWLDPTRGHEVSAAAGFTFNGENPDTNYETGTEFHVEYALMQHFSKAFAAGITGFYGAIVGLQHAFESDVDDWLGGDTRWNAVYLTEPDTLLHLKPAVLPDLMGAVLDRGWILAPHRLQPIPHATDLPSPVPPVIVVPNNAYHRVRTVDSYATSLMDSGDDRPQSEECGNFWYLCGFLSGDHSRLRPYELMRLSHGLGITMLMGSEHGRQCHIAS